MIHRRDEYVGPPVSQSTCKMRATNCWPRPYGVCPAPAKPRIWPSGFDEHGESYVRFITTPGIDPTNNLAEQAIRFVVIDRLVTQGSRSEAGRRWLERIWTVMATCAQQGHSAFEFLAETVQLHFQGQPTAVTVGARHLVATEASYPRPKAVFQVFSGGGGQKLLDRLTAVVILGGICP